MSIKSLGSLLVFISLFCSNKTVINAQNVNPKPSVDSVLYKTILHQDSVLFNAFNSQDIETMKKIFSEDSEFFHDKAGLTTYDKTISNFKKMFDQNIGLKRELVPGSLEVYPIKDFGAIEIGAHTFCHIENGKNDCGTFKFVEVWKNNNGEWKLTRIVSYGH